MQATTPKTSVDSIKCMETLSEVQKGLQTRPTNVEAPRPQTVGDVVEGKALETEPGVNSIKSMGFHRSP